MARERFMSLGQILTVMPCLLMALCLAHAANDVVLDKFNTMSVVASTVPSNGDVNPYGVARIPRTIGKLHAGDILVSNFNDMSNLQGRGTTLMEIARDGAANLFSQINPSALPGPCPGGVGLTTALVVLRSGWVIVGSLPTTDGTSATAQAGCLLVLDWNGNVVETFAGAPINGPWDMTALDLGARAVLFFTNVLNGTVAGNGSIVNGGTVVRMVLRTSVLKMPSVLSMTVIAGGFPERTDPSALVIGPTGVRLRGGTLYVADSLSNRIAAIPRALFRNNSAGIGKDVSVGGNLNDPLGMAIAPNGHILTMNGDDGKIVETTPEGNQVAAKLVDSSGSPPGSGTLFGVAIHGDEGIYFVDDGTNTLNLLH